MQRNGKSSFHPPPTPILRPEASAQLRDRLIAEISDLASGDDAAIWAHRRLPEKYTLTTPDAARVEECFQVRLWSFEVPVTEVPPPRETTDPGETAEIPDPQELETHRQSKIVDKSRLALPEPRRIRDREHVRYVARQSCLVCGRKPCDAHHLRFAQSRALGRKVSDEFTVPLCRGHHREVHRHGEEVKWWRRAAIDPIAAARSLWVETHPRLAAPTSAQLSAKSKDSDTDKAQKEEPRRGRSGRKTSELRNEAAVGSQN
jgi:hypothetical protein